MPEIPPLSGKEVIAAFGKNGFFLVRISGSHHILKKPGHPNNLSVPVHKNQPLKKGTLRGLIRASGLTEEQFRELLD